MITFLSATLTIASITYEGMVLKWFSFVGVSILITDILFLFSTVIGVFYYKNNKTLFYIHLISSFVILTGIVITLIFGKDIPKMLFLLWDLLTCLLPLLMLQYSHTAIQPSGFMLFHGSFLFFSAIILPLRRGHFLLKLLWEFYMAQY